MIAHQTLTQLRTLKLEGMAHAFEEQLTLPATTSLPFEDRFALLVEREAAHRDSTRMSRLLKKSAPEVCPGLPRGPRHARKPWS